MHHPTRTGGEPRPSAATPATPDVVASFEHLTAHTEWTVSGAVRFRRHITTSQRSIEVTVRREELEVEFRHIAEHEGVWFGTDTRGSAVPPPSVRAGPGVFVLREEVPEVLLRVQPYERVVVDIERVVDHVTLHDTARREIVDVSDPRTDRQPGPS